MKNLQVLEGKQLEKVLTFENPIEKIEEVFNFSLVQEVFKSWEDRGIETDEDYQEALKSIKKINPIKKHIDDARLKATEPIRSYLDGVKKIGDNRKELVENAINSIKVKTNAWEAEIEKQRIEAENKVKAELNDWYSEMKEIVSTVKGVSDVAYATSEINKTIGVEGSPNFTEEMKTKMVNLRAALVNEVNDRVMKIMEEMQRKLNEANAKVEEVSAKLEDVVAKVEVKSQDPYNSFENFEAENIEEVISAIPTVKEHLIQVNNKGVVSMLTVRETAQLINDSVNEVIIK